ncbi:MAG TPA: hypothetical protein VIW48_09300, partial [Nitrospiraceae bacterium]
WVETLDKRFMMLPPMCSLLMFEACAKPSTEQIEAAEKAIKEVQANDASTYIPDEYAKIEGTRSALKDEVTHQDGKLALFRDYGEVWQLAVTAKSEAERLKTEGTEKKEETKASALQAQQVAQEVVPATLALVVKAPIGRDRATLESIKADGEALQSSLNQVRMAIDTADYPIAQTQAKAIREKSQAVSREIETPLPRSERENPLRWRRNKVDLLYV